MKTYKPATLRQVFFSVNIVILLSIGIAITILSLSAVEMNIAEVCLGLIFILLGIYVLHFSWKYFFMKTTIETHQISHKFNSQQTVILDVTDISEIREHIHGNLGKITASPGGKNQPLVQSYFIEVIANKDTVSFNKYSIGEIKLFSEALRIFSINNQIKWTTVE